MHFICITFMMVSWAEDAASVEPAPDQQPQDSQEKDSEEAIAERPRSGRMQRIQHLQDR